MVTGGFRSRKGMETAVSSGDYDLCGLTRPAILNPTLPQSVIFNSEIKDEDATLYTKPIDTPWYLNYLGMRSIGAGVENVSSTLLSPLPVPVPSLLSFISFRSFCLRRPLRGGLAALEKV
jgi:hypothetical protein